MARQGPEDARISRNSLFFPSAEFWQHTPSESATRHVSGKCPAFHASGAGRFASPGGCAGGTRATSISVRGAGGDLRVSLEWSRDFDRDVV
jgi:hypothetical protein